ncbi:Chloroperoxidase [Naviculisporaceae sp. PSN 640]
MSKESPKSLTKGTYSPPGPNDLRSPCPFINSLANHGYLPRDGRNILAKDLQSATQSIGGVSYFLSSMLSHPIYLEQPPHHDPASPQTAPSLWDRIRTAIQTGTFPWSVIRCDTGMRPAGQKDEQGRLVLNLDQIAYHGAVEHDISLTRLDAAQGDNLSAQPDLVRQLLESSSDGGKTLSLEDLAELRKRRIEKQKSDNPELVYTEREHRLGCGETALLLGVFGDEKGDRVRADFVRTLFEEERLPVEEGWTRKAKVGFRDVAKISKRGKAVMGITFPV